mgnify:CR=1 FL=1
MTAEEREIIRKHIRTIREKMIGNHVVGRPRSEQIAALQAAVDAMQVYKHVSALPCERLSKVLQYHINNPEACMFRDEVTLAALEAGAKALEYLIT